MTLIAIIALSSHCSCCFSPLARLSPISPTDTLLASGPLANFVDSDRRPLERRFYRFRFQCNSFDR